MNRELQSRKQIFVRNTKSGVIKTVVQYVLQFVLRTVMIYTLGNEYIGISGLFSNIIGCLSLIELGMGTAIVYAMYKPIADNDTGKIISLYNLYRKIYAIIALIIASVGLAIIPLLPYFIKGEAPDGINIQVIYLIFLVNTIVGYLSAHKRALIVANQRNDVESNIRTIGLIALHVAQIVILLLFRDYYLYIICLPLFTIFECLMINYEAKRLFPEIRGKGEPIDLTTRKGIVKNVVALSMHQLGGVLVLSTDSIIISSFLGLETLGIYSNYYAIITSIIACVTLLTTTAQSSLGNLIASEDKEYVYKRYMTFDFIMSWIVAFCSVCLLCLLNPFVEIWTNNIKNVLDISVVLVLVINFYISNVLSLTNIMNTAAGLMWFSRWKPFIQGITNVVVSILLANKIGLLGVVVGTFVSYLIVTVWIEPLVLYKHYFEKSVLHYWKRYFLYFITLVVASVVTYSLCSLFGAGIWNFIIKVLICVLMPNVIMFIFLCKTPEFKEVVGMIKAFLEKLKNRKKNKDLKN